MSLGICLSISTAPKHKVTFSDGTFVMGNDALPYETIAAICSRLVNYQLTTADVASYVAHEAQQSQLYTNMWQEDNGELSWKYYEKNIRDTHLGIIDEIWKPQLGHIGFDNCKHVASTLHAMGYIDAKNSDCYQEYGSTTDTGEVEDILYLIFSRNLQMGDLDARDFINFLFSLGFDELSWS